MPNYRTHSIHGEQILPHLRMMNQHTYIPREDFKTYCIGPDALIFGDKKLFSYQHANNTRDYFLSLINCIKENGLEEKPEIIAFLYGHLDHFVLDTTMHPLINYMTAGLPRTYLMHPHAIVENWIDDYVKQKYNSKEIFYYHRFAIKSEELKSVINEVYRQVYAVNGPSNKYTIGNIGIEAFDVLGRAKVLPIAPLLFRLFLVGPVEYRKNISRVLPYLNLEGETWYNPITGEEYKESFDDLWNKSKQIALDVIDDVNGSLYRGKDVNHPLILNNTSFSTGEPCEKGKALSFYKHY